MGKKKPETWTIAPEQCREFVDKFLRPAKMLIMGGHTNFIGYGEPEFKALEAYNMICDAKTGITFQEEDLGFLLHFKSVIDNFAKPYQMPLLGGELHERVVTAKTYLNEVIPKTLLPQKERGL